MAMGDYGNGNNNSSNSNNNVGSTYYSRLKFRNEEQKLNLSISFRSGLLIFDISAIEEGFKYRSLESIFLSPVKAKQFADEIKKFKEYFNSGDITPGKAFGVCGGMKEKVSYIAVHADEARNVMITIGKFDGNGAIVSSVTITLNKEYHYALEWEDVNSMDTVVKCFNDNIELDQIYETTLDFGRYMNGSIGYSVADISRYDYKRLNDAFDPLYDKLGIERRQSSNRSGGGTNNFLNNSGRATSNSTSFDDIENLLE